MIRITKVSVEVMLGKAVRHKGKRYVVSEISMNGDSISVGITDDEGSMIQVTGTTQSTFAVFKDLSFCL